jgi:hypothetical protein
VQVGQGTCPLVPFERSKRTVPLIPSKQLQLSWGCFSLGKMVVDYEIYPSEEKSILTPL